MADIYHHFPVNGSVERVYDAISTPMGINIWWSRNAKGVAAPGNIYELDFGPGYIWQAQVSRCLPPFEFELTLTDADPEWVGTKIGFLLADKDDATQVSFYHSGWTEIGEHFRISNYCWAMYLRLMKRYVEFGETVAYQDRLDA